MGIITEVHIIFGKPIFFWGGFATIILFLLAFAFGYLLSKGKKGTYKYHRAFAYLTLILGLLHGIGGILFYL